MPRLDVFANPIAEQRLEMPYRIDVQADDLHGLGTWGVIPLRRVRAGLAPLARLVARRPRGL